MKTFTTQDAAFNDNYRFLIGSIVPRPIAVVSTKNHDGSNNLAPFSFFTAVSAKPMIVAFCPMIRTSTGKKKDTVINIEREKEFVINFVTTPWIEKINLTAQELDYGVDEFKASGLNAVPSLTVKAMRLLESPIHFECKLRDVLSYGENLGSGRIITGEVMLVHVDEAIMKDGKIDTDLFSPVGRGAGIDWIHSTHRTQLERFTQTKV